MPPIVIGSDYDLKDPLGLYKNTTGLSGATVTATEPVRATPNPGDQPGWNDVVNTVIAEAGGEGPDGMAAVASVVKNRSTARKQSAVDVVRAPHQFQGYDAPGTASRQAQQDPAIRAKAEEIVRGVFEGSIPDPTSGADHFHADGVNPDWAKTMPQTGRIGGHTFYSSQPQPTKAGAALDRLAGAEERLQSSADYLTSRLVGHSAEHITGMQPELQDRLAMMFQAAPPEIAKGLGIFSGARSVERQTQLWNAAVKKYGSVEAARKWVAPPPGVAGSKGSRHNLGDAADISFNGVSLAKAPKEVVDWVHANAEQYGLAFPLGNEPWHIETTEARSGKGPRSKPSGGVLTVDKDFKPSDPMGLYAGGENPFAVQDQAPELRPFNPDERRPNPDGTYSTELTTTWQLPDGRWVNVPSLWMGTDGPKQFDAGDEEGILGAMQTYETANGEAFPRFASLEEAEAAAKQRSANGGAGAGAGGEIEQLWKDMEGKEPGRYKLIDEGDLENWRKEWDGNQSGQFMKGLKGALIDQNPELAGNALDALGVITSSQRLRDWGKAASEYGRTGAFKRQARVGSVADIRTDSFGNFMSDVGDYAAYSLGQGIGSMAPSVAVGAAGTAVSGGNPIVGFIAGAAGPSYVQNLGDIYGELRDNENIQARVKAGELTEKQVAGWAAAAAIPMAALDAAGLERVIGVAAPNVKRSITRRIVHGLITGALTEGSTEALQQVISEGVQEALGADKSRSEQAISVIDNFVGGALAGGAIGGASHARPHASGTAEAASPSDAAVPETGPMSPDGPAPAMAPVQAQRKGPLTSALEHGERKAAERSGQTFVVNDGPIDNLPAGELHGQTVKASADQSGVRPEMLRVETPDGSMRIIGKMLLVAQPETAPQPSAKTPSSVGAPVGAPEPGSTVRINAPGVEPFMGRVESYQDGEAVIFDSSSGEVYQVPLDAIEPLAAPIGQQPPVMQDKTAPDSLPEHSAAAAPEGIPFVITKDMRRRLGDLGYDNTTIREMTPETARNILRSHDNPVPVDPNDEALRPQPPAAAETKSEMPPQSEQKPAAERFPGPPEPGARVIVDAPGIDRFTGRVEHYEQDGDNTEVVVTNEAGRSFQVPLDSLYVSKLTRKEVEKQELERNPPVPRDPAAAGKPTARGIGDKTVVMPDDKHARLFDLGKERQTSKRLMGASQLDMDAVMPAEQRRLADEFGVTPEAIGSMADDYRYRVERTGKEARSALPVKMHPVNQKRLKQWRSEREKLAAGDMSIFSPSKEVEKIDTPAPQAALDAAAHEAATSPLNDRPEPSQAQKEAGNYAKGHVRMGGMDISIENPAGSERKGVSQSGKPWSVTMKSHYGYFKGTIGRDKDHIDTFVKPGTVELSDTSPVFVVDQRDPARGKFDEHKIMLGFDTEAAARAAYLENYTKGWKGLGKLTPTTLGDFKAWLENSDTTQPFARAAETQAETPKEKPAKAKAPKISSVDRMENYFRVGGTVPSYGGGDRVLAFERLGNDNWQVRVVGVNADGVLIPGERERVHSTAPSKRVLERWERDNPVPMVDKSAQKSVPIAARPAESAKAPQQSAPTAKSRPIEKTSGPSVAEKIDTLFAENKLFTADKVEAARARLKSKMSQINSGIDPEMLIDGMTIAGAYIEAGVRNFADYAKRMTADFGPSIRPYLLSFWEGARNYPGLDNRGMSDVEESARMHSQGAPDGDTVSGKAGATAAEKVNEPAELDRARPSTLEGTPSEQVRAAEGNRETGREPARSGQSDLFGGEPARASGLSAGRSIPDGEGGVSPASVRGSGERTEKQRRAPDASDGKRGSQRPARDEDRVEHPNSAATPAAKRPVEYTLSDADELGQGGAKTKFRNNVAAIRLLRQLEAESRPANRDEQAVLAKWVGWGGLRTAFAREDGSVAKGWDKEAADLKKLLTPEEFRAAESSTRNAHYTSPEIVRAMWSLVDRLGFKGGQVLEPSVGAGNFIGMMPAAVRPAAHVTGVELDHITGGIAKNLYPAANIQAPLGFQDLVVPDAHFDLAIGNPPFGSERLYDRIRRGLNKFSIHNFMFAKSVDALKPGGVLAMVVTNNFLDAADSRARDYIGARADLLGAIRLPNNAFLKNAGTEVTTDIVVLRKRADGEASAGDAWRQVGQWKDQEGRTVPLNEYFMKNPDMMLGEFGAYGTMYRGDEAALVARPGDDLSTLLEQATRRLPDGIMASPGATVVPETIAVPETVHDALVGSMFLSPDGQVMQRTADHIGKAQASGVEFANEKAKDRVAGMVRIRDAFARLRRAQIDDTATDAKLDNLRKRLNDFYDTFERKHGPINSDANRRLFRDDPTWPQISALEEGFDKGVSATVAKATGETARAPSARKAPIFSKRTQQPYRRPTSATSAKDALATVLADLGRVDLDAMSKLYNKSPAAIVDELGPLLYRTPAGAYETADHYLSGNVKAKLAEAQRAAEIDPEYRRNVAALRDVIPADIEPVDIDVKPGAPWVPAQHIADFVDHIAERRGARATYSRGNAKWMIDTAGATDSAQVQWSTNRASLSAVLDAVLNGQTLTIRDRHSDGSSVLNQAATDAANEKAAKVKAEWRRWLWQDDARREKLGRLYNDTFNTDVLRTFDGSHLSLPGKVGDDIISLRPHQKSFVWRVLQSSTALADHVVGAGKTFAVIASVMEMRRVGQAKKPMVVVPNHLVGQWAADFIKLYPGAKILAATKKDFDAENRKRLFARVATGDWDAVIVAHSSFGRIGISPEFERRFIEEQIADLETSISDLRSETGQKSRNVAQLTKARDSMKAKLQRLLDTGAKDEGMTFDELGVDALVVDEAHEFKNLGFATSMQRVAGLGNTQGSQKAADLYMKIQHVLERTGGRNIMFATGTPLSNTMAEMYTVQRYLDAKALRDLGVSHFDAWARVFGEVVSDWELSPSGQYRLNSRFSKFVNMPELMQRYLSFADVITNDDIRSQLAAIGKTLPLPKVKGGKPQNVVVERSRDQAAYIGEGKTDENGNLTFPAGSLVYRAENLPKRVEKGSDNMLKVMSDARKAALDMRLIDPAYDDVPGSKVHVAADNMHRIYKAWHGKKGTQLVFIDLSTPKKARAKEEGRIRDLVRRADEGDDAAREALDKMSPDEFMALESQFSVYDDLREKLIARGIPADEIAFIHDANTDLQKEELFGKVRSGRTRVLFGSTAKMGAGTNVQNRLVALHHLDAPWRPSDLEQRDGRGIRQGNELYFEDPDGFEIEIARYATKNTLDARQWQTIEGKARFIQQVRKGNLKQREIEDIAGEAANAAEMKAAASGNPLILEEMDLRQKLRRYEGQSVEHDREQHRIRMRLREFKDESDKIARDMPAAEQDAAKVAESASAEFSADIGGAKLDKPKDMGAAIIAAGRQMLKTGEQTTRLGQHGGFGLSLQHDHGKFFYVTIEGAQQHDVSINDIDEADPVGVAMRVANTIKRFADQPGRMRERQAEIEQQTPALEKQLGPWKDQHLLDDTKARHREVLDALRPKKQANAGEPKAGDDGRQHSVAPAGWEIADTGEVQRVSEGERQEIERIIRDVSGLDEVQWTERIELPNGAPGWGKDTPTTAGGFYSPTADAITVALDSGSNHVAYHEAFHRLQRLFMNDSERAVLRAEVGRLRRIVASRLGREAQAPKMVQKELEAEAFAIYATGRAPVTPHKALRAVWDRMATMLRRVGNFLAGHGFQTSEDIFDRAKRGDMPRRRTVGAAGSAQSYSASVAPAPRTLGIPQEAVSVSSFRNDQSMKAHPDYRAAKSGNNVAAGNLVEALVKPESLDRAYEAFGEDAIYAPVIAQEATGANAIPWTLAEYYAQATGARSSIDIIQTNKAHHTGARPTERLVVRPLFDGPVAPGGRYVIVDDATVMGSTIAEMANHIRRNGGEVVGIVTLVNAARIDHIAALPKQIREIERRYGDVVRQELGLEPSSLTGSEAAYILNFRDADALRDRIAAASSERRERLRSKEVRAPAPEGEAESSLKNPGDDRLYSISENRVIEEVRGKLTDLQPHVLSAIPLNYFNELAQPNMTAVPEYLRVKRLMDTYRGKKHAEMDAIAQRWLKFVRLGKDKAAALASLMHDATLAGIDPSSMDEEMRAKAGYDALRERYKALPPAGQELFANARDAYQDQAGELDRILLDNVRKAQEIAQRKAEARFKEELERINAAKMSPAARKEALADAEKAYSAERTKAQWSMKARLTKMRLAFEASRVEAPYFPLARFGRYFVTARDVDGTVISFSRRESAADRDRLAADMQKAYPTAKVETGVMESGGGLRAAMDPRMVAEIETILGGANVDSSVMDQIWQRYLESMPDLSTRKRFIHRKGTAGFDSDALRAFSSHMFHAAHQMGRLKYGLELQELTNNVTDQARKAPDATKGMTLANELKKRHQWVMNPTGSKVAQVMTSTAFVWYLATSPAAAVVNMSQTPMLGIPILGARFGGATRAAAAILRASKDTVVGRGSIGKANLSADERRALDAFYESGLIDRTQAHDIAGVGETGVEYSPLRARVMAAMSFLFHRTEVWNREVTALAAYRMARTSGLDQSAAIDAAHDLTWKTHFDYSNSSRPRLMQSDFAKVALVFRAYNINMLYRVFRDFHQSFKGQTPQARREARYQLAGVVGMMSLLAGVSGTFGFNLAMMIAGALLGDDDDPLDFEQTFRKDVLDILGPQLGGVVLNGVPGHYLGIDLTSRIGMPDLWFRSPSRELQGKDEFDYWVLNSLGATVSLAGDAWRGISLIKDGNIERGVEVLAPKWARDLLKSYRYMNEGVTSLNGDQVLDPSAMDAWDAIAQAAGFTPAKVSETYERNSALKNAEQRVKTKRQRLVNAFALAARMGDEDARRDAMAAIKRFNAVPLHRPVAITPDTLRQSLAMRARNAKKRDGGVLIQNPKLGKQLREALPELVYQ